jgi:prepilin peptidase dependent protein B
MLITSRSIKHTSVKRSKAKLLSQGMSIVELLIGVAIGLFLLAGASTMFVGNVTNSRRILLETRINQDLRATMDLVTRDLRRGAYWENSLAGTLATGSTSITQPNPYSAVTTDGSTQINYRYTRDTPEDNVLNSDTEQFGFRLNTSIHAVQMKIGASWQTITHTDILTIPNNGFVITPTETAIDIRSACAKTCTGTSCPQVQVRTYNIVLTGVSKTDTAVSRTLRSQIRVRNDALSGSCPA